MMGISVVLLAYKEAENLEILLPQIIEQVKNTGEEYEIVVIDGKISQDNSEEICKKYNSRYVNQEEPYFGGAYRTAIKYANYDKYLVLDCDGSHPTDRIPEMYRVFTEENCDVVIGSRYVEGGKTYDSLSSILMSKLLNNTYKIFLGIQANDLSAGYRMYRTELLKNIDLKSNNFDLMQEILVKMKIVKPDLKIREIPITFKKRMYGESKRNLPMFIYTFICTLFRLKIYQIYKTFVKS